MRLLLVFLISQSVWAAAYTASASGNWSTASTWGGSGVPGNGDSVTINDGVTVTVSDFRFAGASGGNGTVAINTRNTGALVIANGGVLELRGDIQYASGGGSNTTSYLTIQAGGILEFDSSQALFPAATTYAAHPDSNNGYRGFVTLGTSANRAVVRSNGGGGNGRFSLGGHMLGGSYVTTYTDFLRIGDASNPAFEQWNPGTNLTPWDATHDTFTSCGMAPSGAGSLFGMDIFRHDYNVHTNSLGPSVFHRPDGDDAITPMCYSNGVAYVPAGCTSAGVREIMANVFDISPDSGLDARDFTIHSNYIPDRLGTQNANTHTWWYFQNNFVRWPQSSPTTVITLQGDSRDNLWFLDEHTSNNPHGPNVGPAASAMMSGDIVDHAGQLVTSVSAWMECGISNPNTYTLRNSILLPNALGGSSFWFSAIINLTPLGTPSSGDSHTIIVNHNTGMFNSVNGGVGMLTAHTTTYPDNPGQFASYRSNILWNPVASNQAYKLVANQMVNMNVCAPANCDYNDGFNMATDGGAAMGFTGGGNGYADNFSSTPGIHDLAADPMFLDPTRNTATFDTGYLGNTASSWNGAASYNVGDILASGDPSVYSNAVINYRYINGTYHGVNCQGANPKPGMYSDLSRACWEWASLYRIRQGVAAQTLYDDQTIGAHGVDIITVLIQWIRSGFSPTNPALALAGHDGQDIGAVPVTFDPATFTPNNQSQGIQIKGIVRGVIR